MPIGRFRTIGECFLQCIHSLLNVVVMLMRKQTSHNGSCPTNTTPAMNIHIVSVTFIQDSLNLPNQFFYRFYAYWYRYILNRKSDMLHP